jgi:two-component system chemotaxis response regulator CheB
MHTRNIIVIGASAGGLEALQTLVSGLPENLEASIFVVWHMAPEVRGVLPSVLSRAGKLPATHAIDRELIEPGHIYIAPPDRHMLLEEGRIRVTRGPKENRFRPAVDPLFRSAAFVYGAQVIGVVLSGALDDGTSGLWTIKLRGGIAVVQDPHDAAVSSMPENALREVEVDHKVPAAAMGDLLTSLSREPITEDEPELPAGEKERLEHDVRIALQEPGLEHTLQGLGELSPYACPDCHGVMELFREDSRVRYRCHTGHAYSTDSLLLSLTERVEVSVWNAIRGLEETLLLLNQLGDYFAEENDPRVAARHFQKAKEAQTHLRILRQIVFQQDNFSVDDLVQQPKSNGNHKPPGR